MPMLYNPAFTEAIHDFNDFLRKQKGAYTDACAGYRRNEVRIRRQESRVLKPRAQVGKDGKRVIVHTSVIDPTHPDVLIETTRLASEYIDANRPSGAHEQQLCRALLIFIYTYWEYVVRPACAEALSIKPGDLKLPIAGDLRLFRHAILHDRGMLTTKAHSKLEVLNQHFASGIPLVFSHSKMHEIFRLLDKQIGRFVIEMLQMPEPPGGIDDLKQIVIQRNRPAGR